MSKTIDRLQLLARLATMPQPILVEALPAKYFADGHLPGARHLPHDEVRARAATVLPDRHAPVVVYCASATCQNSHIAAQVLEQIGYTDVAVYAGGKKDWTEAGLPIEAGTRPIEQQAA
jgi:rhodanese-related sulfurtransferase